MTTIRRATPDDIPALARTLTLAFADYVWIRWSVPQDDYLQRLEALLTLDMKELGLVFNEVWTTDDCTAVALWIPPKEVRTGTPDLERHTQESERLLGDRLAVIDEGDALVAPFRPIEPSWYLATMGVHPDHQRKGLGSAVLRPVLERCDREGMACSLETSSAENVAFYERQGFTIHAEVTLPNDGPMVWIMWRKPAGPSRSPDLPG